MSMENAFCHIPENCYVGGTHGCTIAVSVDYALRTDKLLHFCYKNVFIIIYLHSFCKHWSSYFYLERKAPSFK